METEQSISTDANALKTFLVEHVRKHYAQTNEDLLLANVGWALNNQRPELREKLGRRTVGQFIRRELSEQLDMPRNLGNPTEQYVYLKGQADASVPSSTRGATTAAATSVKSRKYAHAVFLAFTRPVTPGYKRFLMLGDPIHFRDILDDAEAPGEGVEIESTLIVPPSAGQSKAEVLQELNKQVDHWLRQNGLQLNCVLEQSKLASADGGNHISLWDLLLASLTEAERKRIQLPLDIIAKLQNTPK
ncbi:hypothetical protein [Rhodoferax sp.]|uniref:hypothetical protein n=1 Tax=Rhodoferax sp. TaxID=50421 RepID=UPI002ACD59B2|nr:hypothetical protein [Rhodoferax sp.]MDZ7920392.1 hypothetical protein [Rhodoferax sp.]